MTRNSSLILLLIASIISALAVRMLLTTTDLNGTTLLPLGIVSLNLEYTINTGINFGIAGEATSSRQFQLAGLAFAVCAVVILWGVRSRAKWAPTIAGLFAGGGLANAYERIAYGGVFDYLNVSFVFYENPYSFNLADIYIFIGALMYIFKPSSQ